MQVLLAALLVLGVVLIMLIAAGGIPGPIALHKDRAEKRAEALIRDVLTAGEYDQLDRVGYLEVPSKVWPGRTYRVRPRRSPVAVVDNGTVVAHLCLQPIQSLPGREIVLAHKLLLESDERGYWTQANLLPGLPGGLSRTAL